MKNIFQEGASYDGCHSQYRVGHSFVSGVAALCMGHGARAPGFISMARLIDRFTPNIDEQKEIVRGNSAVAEYYGRLVSAAILGVSIVMAAAVLGGVIAALPSQA